MSTLKFRPNRSPAISQRLLGTEEIFLIHHTDRGMLTFTDDAFKRATDKVRGFVFSRSSRER